jgi:hypothetical protein
VARKDLDKLQPMSEIIQQLWKEELIGVHLLWTFFSCQIQPLRWWATKMWLYPGPSCPNRPFSEELSVAEINTWIYKVLDHGANPNLGAGLAP